MTTNANTASTTTTATITMIAVIRSPPVRSLMAQSLFVFPPKLTLQSSLRRSLRLDQCVAAPFLLEAGFDRRALHVRVTGDGTVVMRHRLRVQLAGASAQPQAPMTVGIGAPPAVGDQEPDQSQTGHCRAEDDGRDHDSVTPP